MANGDSQYTMEVRFVAADEGLTKVLGEVEKATGRVEEKTKRGGRAMDDYGRSATGTTRGVRLLTSGILSELDPALAGITGRFNQAAVGVRLLGSSLSGPAVLGIATAVAALLIYIKKITDATEQQAKFNLAIRAADPGPAIAKLQELSLEMEKTRLNMETTSGKIVEAFKLIGRQTMDLNVQGAAVNIGAGVKDAWLAYMKFITVGFFTSVADGFKAMIAKVQSEGLSGILSGAKDQIAGVIGKATEDPRIKEAQKALTAFQAARGPQSASIIRANAMQLEAVLAGIRTQELQLGTPTWLSMRITLAEEARKNFIALKDAIEDQGRAEIASAEAARNKAREDRIRALPDIVRNNPTELKKDLARIDAELSAQLKIQTAGITAKVGAAINQESEKAYQAQHATLLRFVGQIKAAGGSVNEAFEQFMRNVLVPRADEEALLEAHLSMLGLSDPQLAKTQREIVARLRELQEMGFTGVGRAKATQLGGGQTSFNVPTDPTSEAFLSAQAKQKETEDAFRRFIAVGFAEGGPAEQANREAIVAAAKSSQALGRTLHSLMKVATEEWGVGFSEGLKNAVTEIREAADRQAEIMRSPGIERPFKQAAEDFDNEVRRTLGALDALSPEKLTAGRARAKIDTVKMQERFKLLAGLPPDQKAMEEAVLSLIDEVERLDLSGVSEAMMRNIVSAGNTEQGTALLVQGWTATIRKALAEAERGARDPNRTLDEQGESGLKAGLLRMRMEIGEFGEDVARGVQEIGQTINRGLGDAFFNFATGQFSKFSDVWTNLWQGLARTASNITSQLIERMILQWLGYERTIKGLQAIPGGGGGGIIGTLLGLIGMGGSGGVGGGAAAAGAAGGVYVPGDLFGGAMYTQHGGIFTRPQMRIIGEAGPEAVIPLSKLGSNGMGGGGGGVTVINLIKEEELAAIMAQEVGKGRQVTVVDVLDNIRSNRTIRRGIRTYG